YQEKLLRFIENHDEPRAAATFSPAKERAAALTASTLPGARLSYEGQIEGRKIRLPVFLGRRAEEPVDQELRSFYTRLLAATDKPVFRDGQWRLCECTGWPDNSSYQNLVAWSWVKDDESHLVVVNLSDAPVQARVQIPWGDLQGRTWHLVDALSDAAYERDGDELAASGLYVELGPWNYYFFRCRRNP